MAWGWKKTGQFLLLAVIFSAWHYPGVSSRDRTNETCSMDTIGITIFMANSRKNDQPNKLLVHAIKKSASGIGGREQGIEKKGWRGMAKASASGGWQREEERAGRYHSWGEFGKVDGRYYGAGVKNERDVKKKISSSVPLSAPIDRGRRVSHLIKVRRKKEKCRSSASPAVRRSNYGDEHGPIRPIGNWGHDNDNNGSLSLNV